MNLGKLDGQVAKIIIASKMLCLLESEGLKLNSITFLFAITFLTSSSLSTALAEIEI